MVGRTSAGWIHKGFKFPGWIDAGVYLKIQRVEEAVGCGRPRLQVFDV